jgi:nucleotide-binding universal stress UspA family protein
MQTGPVPNVVVGYDGSAAAETAVDWGALQAERRRAPLRIVSAIPWPYDSLGMAPQPTFDPARLAEELAGEGRDRAIKRLDPAQVPAVEVTAVGVPANAATALVTESAAASLVVLGHSGRSRLAQVFTGSTTVGVAAHAECDVAVVPAGKVIVPGPDRPVVVGVDGSEVAQAAALRAGQEADRWGAPLRIVQSWTLALTTGWSGALAGTTVIDGAVEAFGTAARASVNRAADAVLEAFPDLQVDQIVVEEHPARVLVEMSDEAGLVVVGTRGLGGFERLVLGSVSRYVVQHAGGPVVVVRG